MLQEYEGWCWKIRKLWNGTNKILHYKKCLYNLMLAAESRVKAMNTDVLSGHRAYEPECI